MFAKQRYVTKRIPDSTSGGSALEQIASGYANHLGRVILSNGFQIRLLIAPLKSTIRVLIPTIEDIMNYSFKLNKTKKKNMSLRSTDMKIGQAAIIRDEAACDHNGRTLLRTHLGWLMLEDLDGWSGDPKLYIEMLPDGTGAQLTFEV